MKVNEVTVGVCGGLMVLLREILHVFTQICLFSETWINVSQSYNQAVLQINGLTLTLIDWFRRSKSALIVRLSRLSNELSQSGVAQRLVRPVDGLKVLNSDLEQAWEALGVLDVHGLH